MIDFSWMPLMQILWETGLYGTCKIGTLHRFFQVTYILSVEIPRQIAIHLALWEVSPIIPTLTLFSWPSQPLAENLLPESVSQLLTWPIFLLTLKFCAFSFCLDSLAITPLLVLVAPGLCLAEKIYSLSRFTFSWNNSNPPMQSGICQYSWELLVSC